MGLGGSGGTSIAAGAMQVLPIGVPKIMVSTMASGNTRPYVGFKDIIMINSIVDIAGLNTISRKILYNAALSLCGMIYGMREAEKENITDKKVVIGATMLGVTTPCVMEAKKILESKGYEVLIFHANGAGGQAMEELIKQGEIAAVMDITTTEIINEVCGGTFATGSGRMEASSEKGTPRVVSLGGLDMSIFTPPEALPPQYRNRLLYSHNPSVTLMRTNVEENKKVAKILAEKLNRACAPITLVVPEGGFSSLDAPGQPFYGPDEDQALIEGLLAALNSKVKVIRRKENINDPVVARVIAEELLQLLEGRRERL